MLAPTARRTKPAFFKWEKKFRGVQNCLSDEAVCSRLCVRAFVYLFIYLFDTSCLYQPEWLGDWDAMANLAGRLFASSTAHKFSIYTCFLAAVMYITEFGNLTPHSFVSISGSSWVGKKKPVVVDGVGRQTDRSVEPRRRHRPSQAGLFEACGEAYEEQNRGTLRAYVRYRRAAAVVPTERTLKANNSDSRNIPSRDFCSCCDWCCCACCRTHIEFYSVVLSARLTSVRSFFLSFILPKNQCVVLN